MFEESRRLSGMLGVEHPIIQAPMAGVTTPELAASVALAGALGSLGCAALSASEVRRQVGDFRRLTGGKLPIHLNFFTHARPRRDGRKERHAMDLVAPFYEKFGLGPVPEPSEPYAPFDDERLELLLELKPEIVSFHFGLPAADRVGRLKAAGLRVLGSATTVEEALILEKAGVDAVIAQGAEAGGHRGTFAGDLDGGLVGSISLIPQIADAVDVPVIAAGGIADGRGMLAALMLGASGVQLGTAFLRSPEANVAKPHRDAIANGREDGTRITRAFSGRPARSLRNPYLDRLAPHDADLPDFPLMNALSMPLRATADRSGDCLPLWAGQSLRLAQEKPAGDIVRAIVADMQGRMPPRSA